MRNPNDAQDGSGCTRPTDAPTAGSGSPTSLYAIWQALQGRMHGADGPRVVFLPNPKPFDNLARLALRP